MAKTMTKAAILNMLAEKTDQPKKTVVTILNSLCVLAYKEAKNGFVLPGFGKLVVVNRKARMGRNPQTGEKLKIPAKRVLKFRIAKVAKDTVLGTK